MCALNRYWCGPRVMQSAVGHADVRDLRLEHAGVVEDLDALVPLVGDVDVAGRVDGDRVRRVELPRLRSARAPRREESAVLVELRDARVGAVAVGDEDVALGVPGHVARPVELIAGAAGSGWRISAPASTATTSGRRRRGRRHPHGDRFRLPAHHHQDAAVGPELDDLVRSFVDDPDVVLRVDADRVREEEAVDALPDLTHERAGLIELEEPRAAVREDARVAETGRRIAGAGVDEKMPGRVRWPRPPLRRGGCRPAS